MIFKDNYLNELRESSASVNEVDCLIEEVMSKSKNSNAMIIIPSMISLLSIFVLCMSSLINIDYSNRQVYYSATISYINGFDKNSEITNEIADSKFFESMADLFEISSVYETIATSLITFLFIIVVLFLVMMFRKASKNAKLGAYYEYKRELIRTKNTEIVNNNE